MATASISKAGPQAKPVNEMKKPLLITLAAVIVVVGGIMLYSRLSTISPPEPGQSKPEEIVDFLGHPRGFARMPYAQRDEYIARAVEQCSSPEQFNALRQSLARMTRHERDVFQGAVFDTGRRKFMDKARDYNQLSPSQRPGFVNEVIQEWENYRARISGPPGSAALGDVFESDLPSDRKEWTKLIFSKTSAKDRTEGNDFFLAVQDRGDELRDRAR